jgi:hypothetical protein
MELWAHRGVEQIKGFQIYTSEEKKVLFSFSTIKAEPRTGSLLHNVG